VKPNKTKENELHKTSKFVFWNCLTKDSQAFNPTHISIYIALFQLFGTSTVLQNLFNVKPGGVMRIAKVGSKSTYHRCFKRIGLLEIHQGIALCTNPYKRKPGTMLKFGNN